MAKTQKKKEYKYQYWHIVTKCNPDRKDLSLKIGNVISHEYVKEGVWETFNMISGESSWICEADYIGRTLTTMEKDEKIKRLKEFTRKYNGKDN